MADASGRGPAQMGEDEIRACRQLTAVLMREAQLLDDLRCTLLKLRTGVEHNDARSNEASLHQLSGTLLTIEELRAQRAGLIEIIAGDRALPLRALDGRVPAVLMKDVMEARDRAYRAATAVAREAAINHQVVRQVLDAGESFLQSLFSSVTAPDSINRPEPPPSTQATDEGRPSR